jgi:hypothetical protein
MSMGSCASFQNITQYRFCIPRKYQNFETQRLGNARQKELQSGSKRSEPLPLLAVLRHCVCMARINSDNEKL